MFFWGGAHINIIYPLGFTLCQALTRGRSFHSKPFVSILNFQTTEQPTRTENDPNDFCGGTANIPQGKPQSRPC